MKEFDDYSTKEQKQLAICQRLISEKSYLSQEALRRDLQHHGFTGISQSTVSRLLKLLGAIKIRNTKGQKIYSVNPQSRPLLMLPDRLLKWWSALSTIANLSSSTRRQVMAVPLPESSITTRYQRFWVSSLAAVLSGLRRELCSERGWCTSRLTIYLK